MELFHREYGEGKPLLILHGLFGMSDNWVTMARRIASSFHVYIPDMRNHGQSPQSSHHSYPAMAEDIAEFVDKFNIKNPILMGHSMGGKVAMLYATEHSSSVEKLIVVDIAPKVYNLRDQHLDILNVMMEADLLSMKTRMDVEDYVEKRIPDKRIQLFVLKNLYRPSPDRFAWRVNLQAIFDNLDLIASDTPFENKFIKPALFIRGALSDYILDADIPKIKNYFPLAEISTIENAGHWVHADAPKEMCREISRFTDKDCTL